MTKGSTCFPGRLAGQKMRKWSAHVIVLCLSWRVPLIHLNPFGPSCCCFFSVMQVANVNHTSSCTDLSATSVLRKKSAWLFPTWHLRLSLIKMWGSFLFNLGKLSVQPRKAFFSTLEGFKFNPCQKFPPSKNTIWGSITTLIMEK